MQSVLFITPDCIPIKLGLLCGILLHTQHAVLLIIERPVERTIVFDTLDFAAVVVSEPQIELVVAQELLDETRDIWGLHLKLSVPQTRRTTD